MAYGILRLTPDQFWSYTPKEITLIGKGVEKRYGDGKPKKMSGQEISSNIDEVIKLISERGKTNGSR
jgi:hypothetical protein